MGPQGSGTDQAGIGPCQCLLQSATVTLSPQLGRTSSWGGQAAIEADGQHQPDRWAGALQNGDQTAATDSRAAGMRSN